MEASTTGVRPALAFAPGSGGGRISLRTLLRWQLHLSLAAALRGGRARNWRRLVFVGLGAIWLGVVGLGVDFLLTQAAELHPEAPWLPDVFVHSAWLGALAVTLFLNLGFLLHLVFFARDVAFLMAAPVDPRHVMLVRFAEAMGANLFMTLFLTLPTTVAVGMHAGAGPSYYLVALAALGGFMVIPVALTFLIGIPLASRVPATRLKAIFSILGFVSALILWVIPYQLSASGNARWDILLARADGLRRLFESTPGQFIPSTWGAGAVVAALHGDAEGALVRLLGLAAAAAALTALAVFGCAGVYREGWAKVSTVAEGDRPQSQRWDRLLPGFPRRLRAFFWKDLCLVGRDFRLMFQLYSIGAMFCVFPFIVMMSRGTPMPAAMRPMMALSSSLGTAVIVACQAGMLLVPVEGLAGYRMLTAPLRPIELALTKWLSALFLTLPIVGLQLPIIAFGFGLDSSAALTGFLWALVGAVIGSALGVCLGAAFPNFAWDHPKRMVQPAAQLGWGIGVASIVLVLAVLGQLGAIYGPAWLGGPRLPVLTLIPAGLVAAAGVALTAQILARLEWPN